MSLVESYPRYSPEMRGRFHLELCRWVFAAISAIRMGVLRAVDKEYVLYHVLWSDLYMSPTKMPILSFMNGRLIREIEAHRGLVLELRRLSTAVKRESYRSGYARGRWRALVSVPTLVDS